MELARRRRMERRKAAEKRARQALLAALGLMPLKKPKKRKKKKKTTGGKSKKREAASGVGQGPASPAAEPAAEPGAELAAQGNQGQGKRPKPITREDILKLAIADELGYLDTVRTDGWGGLSTAQSGRVGGTMTRRMKRLERDSPPS